MSLICVNDAGQLVVTCPYDCREHVKLAGGQWDPVIRAWVLAFSPEAIEALIDTLPEPEVHPDVETILIDTLEKQKKLKKIRAMSKVDHPVRLKVPGLSGSLYNYQKLGVMFSLTNGRGVLVADEMGLGKTLQAISTALYLKHEGKIEEALIITPPSLKFNWALEIEKWTNEPYVVIDGAPDDRVAQWLNEDAFFYVVNFELLLEDLFGGRNYKGKEDETNQQRLEREARMKKAARRAKILKPVKERQWGFIAVDECFTYDTLVLTNKGFIKIGEIVEKKLDLYVLSYNSLINETSMKSVVNWYKKPLKNKLVEVCHEKGRFICTENHKIWTKEYGYVKAKNLCTKKGGSTLFTLPDGIRNVKEGEEYSEILFQEVCKQFSEFGEVRKNISSIDSSKEKKDMRRMSEGVCGSDSKRENEKVLFKEMLSIKQSQEGRQVGIDEKDECMYGEVYEGKTKSRSIVKNEKDESRQGFSKKISRRGEKMEKGESNMASTKWGKREDNGASENTLQSIKRRMGDGIYSYREKEICRSDRLTTESLFNRHCESTIKNSNRSGWEVSQNNKVEDNRQEKRKGFVSSRVESVKILESGDYDRLGLSGKQDYVYDLEVEDNHNYIADGVLVSNCHALKNHKSKRTKNVRSLRSKFRMGLTGTPMDGRLEELHSVMEFVCPGLLGSYTRFMQRHAETDNYGKVKKYKRIGEVRDKIAPHFIRRLKKDVLHDLPDKIYSNRMIIMSNEEKRIYNALADHGHKATREAEQLVATIRCKQFCNTPQLVADAMAKEEEPDEKEIKRLRKMKSSKLESFKEVLEEVVIENAHKVLVFSQYAEMVKIMMKVFDEMGLKYLCIWGETDKKVRAEYQKSFNEDKTIDIMVGTEAMSTGLNFTSADYVINYDDNWAPAFMAQREDRAHRIGQKNVVTVINFVCKDTIEERIRSVLYHKSAISAQALGDDTDEMVLKRLGPKEVAKLL